MVQVPLLQRVDPARAGAPRSASVQPGDGAAAQVPKGLGWPEAPEEAAIAWKAGCRFGPALGP